MGSETGPRGVTALDHTADVGIVVEAPNLEELFLRAAAGMMWLLQGGEGGGDRGEGFEETTGERSPKTRSGERDRSSVVTEAARTQARELSASAADLPALLREWLRELLFWYEVEGLAFQDARFEALSDTGLRADVMVAPHPSEPIREIKGVTLHGLAAEPRQSGWVGRVIFDV